MKPQFRIRTGTESDAAAVARLAGDLGYATPVAAMEERLRSLCRSDQDLLLVAVLPENVPVAFLQAHAALIVESGFRVEIVGLMVGDEFRRRGIGRGLVAAAQQWASHVGASSIIVRSNVTREESHEFYRALGYSPVKTQHVYRKVLTG